MNRQETIVGEEIDKWKRITDMSDADFLSFLYAERDRENSLKTYQGWNNWAVVGALATVICYGYRILSKNIGDIDWLDMGFYLSGLISFLLFIRHFTLLFSRKRGVDYKKVKTLKEVSPKHYLVLAIFCSVFFSLFLSVFNKEHPFHILTITWIVVAFIYIAISLTVHVNRNRIVRPDIDGLIFASEQWECCFGYVIGGVLSFLSFQSFKNTNGAFIGLPDFELAVCFAAILMLFYLLLIINFRESSSVNLDVLIDEFLFMGCTKESIYQQILISRMGYGVLDVCKEELLELEKSINEFGQQRIKIAEVGELLASGSFDREHINSYLDIIQQGLVKSKKWNDQICRLDRKLKEIISVEPVFENTEEYQKLFAVDQGLIKISDDLMRVTIEATNKMNIWVRVYHCKKFGGWCMRECEERNDQPSLRYSFEVRWMKMIGRLSSVVKFRKLCKN